MLVKSQVKYIQSLGHKKFRDADGVFVAEGPKIVKELLGSENLRLIECFATSDWLQEHAGDIKGREKQFIQIDKGELERISFHSSPHEVLAIFTKPVFVHSPKEDGLTLILDNIQDPGNLGTIIRTADWFGVNRVVASLDTVDTFNPKVVQSAMGSLIRVEVIYTDLEDFILENRGTELYSSSLEGEDLHQNISYRKAMLLMGNESKGVSQVLDSLATKRIRIPRSGKAESLNVGIATGILLSRMEKI